MPVFLLPAAAAAYHYHKKSSSCQNDSDDDDENHSGTEKLVRSQAAESVDNNIESTKKTKSTLLENWNEKYGKNVAAADSCKSRQKTQTRRRNDMSCVFQSNTCISIEETAETPAEAAVGALISSSEMAASVKQNASKTLLESWNERYPKSTHNRHWSTQKVGGGRLIRSLLQTRNGSSNTETQIMQPQRREESEVKSNSVERRDIADLECIYTEVASVLFKS